MSLIPWQTTIQNQYGSIVASPIITVRDENGDLASIYDEFDAAKSNPFVGEVDGFAQFYAEAGRYIVQGSYDGFVTNPWIINLFDAESVDLVATLAAKNAAEAAAAQTAIDADVTALNASAALASASAAAASAGRISLSALDEAVLEAQTAAENAQSSALTVSTWTDLSALTSGIAGTGAEVLDSDVGTHTDPVVGGTVDNAGRYSWSTSPAGWERIGGTGLSGKASLNDIAYNPQRYTVAAFGLEAEEITFNTDGTPIDVTTKYVQKSQINRPQIYIVPAFGYATSVAFGSNGVPISAVGEFGLPPTTFPVGDTVADVTSVEVRAVPGIVTGRSLDQLHLRRSTAVYVPVTFGPTPVRLLSTDVTNGVASVRRGGNTHSVNWRTTPLGDGTFMHLYLIMGQSLAQGWVNELLTDDHLPSWRDLVADRAWQFRAGDDVQRGPRSLQVSPISSNKGVQVASTQLERLEPLRGAQHAYNDQQGQTTAETLAAAMIGQHLDHREHVLATIIGTGSTAIVDFAVGTPHYLSAQAAITEAYTQATLRNRGLKVWLIWNQGEQDNSNGTAQATYEVAWIAIRNGLSTHTTSVGGTFGGSVIQQCLQRPSGLTGMATLAHASLISSGEALGVMIQTCQPGYNGSTHLYPLTYLPLGSATAYEISRMMVGGSPTTPYIASGDAHLTTSTQIDCTISGGTGTFVFDTTTMPADTNGTYGLRVYDTSGEITISSVTLTSANNLRITLSAPVLLINTPRVEVGLHGGSNLTAASSARVNIRDDSAWPCGATGQIISGWMLHHKVTVVA